MTAIKKPGSKELFMMNGGNKLYIYKDGFGDIYHATAEEEAAWTKEIIENNLRQIDTEQNAVGLKFAIDNLLFHGYESLRELLIEKLKNEGVTRQIVLAASLWRLYQYEKSFGVIHQHFLHSGKACIDDIFWALTDFKNNKEAERFLIECLEAADITLIKKAHTTLTMWAYTGMPQLRNNELLERLAPVNKGTKEWAVALEELKKILQISH